MPRICVVADIHHGQESFTKKGPAAEALMDQFVDFANQQSADLVIDLGDRISDVEHDTDMRLEQEAAAFFSPLKSPVRHICGNHDRDHLSVQENADILGQSMHSEVIELDGWQLVVWRADSKIHRPGGFVLPESDLLWLAHVIQAAEIPTAVFTHVPLSGHDQTGNYYFERNPDASHYTGATDRIRAILATARVPLATFAGHVHWNTVTTISGQPHFTLQSLTESFTTAPHPAGAYALLELSDDIIWTVHGRDRLHVSIPVAQTNRRWIEKLPTFKDHPEIRQQMLSEAK